MLKKIFLEPVLFFKMVFGVFFLLLMGGIIARNSFVINYELFLGIIFLLSLILLVFNQTSDGVVPVDIKRWFFREKTVCS